jgi:hypothetical protein
MCFLGIGGMIKNVIPLTFIRQTTFLGASVNTKIILFMVLIISWCYNLEKKEKLISTSHVSISAKTCRN